MTSSSDAHRRWTVIVQVALVLHLSVIIALTLLKSVIVIGHLWTTEAHRHRGVELAPLTDFWNASSVFAAAFNVVGNLCLFIPLGFLLAVRSEQLAVRSAQSPLRSAQSVPPGVGLAQGSTGIAQPRGLRRFLSAHPVLAPVVFGAAASLAIEVTQYIVAAGYSDIDDLLYNTVGTVIGAVLATRLSARWQRIGVCFFLACGLTIWLLYAIGPRLGHPVDPPSTSPSASRVIGAAPVEMTPLPAGIPAAPATTASVPAA